MSERPMIDLDAIEQRSRGSVDVQTLVAELRKARAVVDAAADDLAAHEPGDSWWCRGPAGGPCGNGCDDESHDRYRQCLHCDDDWPCAVGATLATYDEGAGS